MLFAVQNRSSCFIGFVTEDPSFVRSFVPYHSSREIYLETQLLEEFLNERNVKTIKVALTRYHSPKGVIVGAFSL